MENEKTDWKKKIRSGLEALTITVSNPDRVRLMVQSFINETNEHFVILRKTIEEERKKDIQPLLHKLKARYGYFGLEELMVEMDSWEKEQSGIYNQVRNIEKLDYFEKMNSIIMREMKEVGHEHGGLTIAQPLKGKKILVAEDDEINAMVFELFIEELGGEVLKATDGHEATRQAMENPLDFIFMDIHMPYFSGVEAIQLLRSKNVNIPIVALSASTRLQEKQQSIDAGANEFLTKPAKRDAIREVLLKYLSVSS